MSVTGPVLGGVITDALSWRWIFYVNLPVGMVALSLILVALPRSERPRVGISMMSGAVGEVLLRIRTVAEMVEAFADEARCRRLVEALVWPDGRVCPACGYKRSIALAGRDMGRYRARPGLYQCSNGACRFQFTATTRTPLHSTKLPLSTWLKALWLVLQSDKGLSSIRLAEALGVSQPTAWRMGHALRLMLGARENPLGGTVEIDEFFLGGRPKKRADEPPPGRGRKGLRRTTSAPFWRSCSGRAQPHGAPPPAMLGPRWLPISRWMKLNACSRTRSTPAPLDERSVEGVYRRRPRLRRARHRSAWAPRICSRPGSRQLGRGVQSPRVQRTVAGVFHHISPEHADLYFHEIGFRWSQRVAEGEVIRRTRHGREKVRTLWSRVPPALQLPRVFRAAIGREMRRTRTGGITIKSAIAVFG